MEIKNLTKNQLSPYKLSNKYPKIQKPISPIFIADISRFLHVGFYCTIQTHENSGHEINTRFLNWSGNIAESKTKLKLFCN